MFISLEGIPGSGKTTQCEFAKIILENAKCSVTVANEPDMTTMGTLLRELRFGRIQRNKLCELFIALAEEAQLYSEIIIPELAIPNHYILRDGGAGTLLSHYYVTTRLSIEKLIALFNFVSSKHQPIVTLVLDISPEIAEKRLGKRNTHLGSLSVLKLQRDVLLRLAKILPNWYIIDGAYPIEHVCNTILSRMQMNELLFKK